MNPQVFPNRLDVKRDQGITILWSDGRKCVYSLVLLRSMCPCARCKEERAQKQAKKTLLNVLPGNYTEDLKIAQAEMVGNYAIKLAWTDGHDTGIYSFSYLRELGERGG